MRRAFAFGALRLMGFACAAAAFACSPSSGKTANGGLADAGRNHGVRSDAGTGTGVEGGFFLGLDAGQTALRIAPATTTLTVDPGSATPSTIQFTATGQGGAAVLWHVTNDGLGGIDQNGLFTANGQIGGEADIEASVGSSKAVAHIIVNVQYRQNGASAANSGDAGAQAGGLGGVGGEGFGAAVPPALASTLEGMASADASLKWLYPYDQTVFPLNVLPPLLQWSDGGNGNFDAVYIHLSAPPYYDYKGFFGRPSALAAGANFVRHPIPPDVWSAATRTAAGSVLKVELVLSAGGKAYGPITESFKIALGRISGKIYYQAYNTVLAQNQDTLAITGDRFGGATLSIKVGDQAPKLVAGKTTADLSGCRVCHSVSAYGDRMVVQHGDNYTATSTYDLKNGNAESTPYNPGQFGLGWTGLYPDGTLGLANSVDVAGGVLGSNTGLYDMTTGAPVQVTGLNEFATKVGLPMFSPDGRHVAFTLFDGPSTPAVGAPTGRQLVVMDFDLATKTFSNPRKLWETTASDERPAWPTFFPSSTGIVFMRHFQGTANEAFSSRYGARGELWWADLATGNTAPLAELNGGAYLPKGPNNHDADEQLDYEPTISPVASGGYAWIVFMSRREYGNVATIDPWWSDPREHNLRDTVTSKKIWMAALDLNPQPGKDPSHPAFYIPGQELHGSNSRPFFALEPCLSDRGTCSTGIDCCSGFCRDGFCVTPPVNECAKDNERCAVSSDCCNPESRCIGGFCATLIH